MSLKSTWILGCLLLTALSVSAQGTDQDYLDPPRWTPYRITHIHSEFAWYFTERTWTNSAAVWDLEGDGVDEIVCVNYVGTSLRIHQGIKPTPLWQEPLPVEFAGEDCSSGVEGVWYFDDPEQPESLVKVISPDRSRWYFERRRLVDGQLMGHFIVAGGQDLRGDGDWDGNFKALGVVQVPVKGASVTAVILLAEAGWDLQPRGAMAVDANTGQILWQYLVGPKPHWINGTLLDLDGDTQPEILFSGSAVDNIHGPTFNGTSDQVSSLFALDAAGRLLWRRDFGSYPASTTLVVPEYSSSGPVRLLTATGNTHEPNTLSLLDETGQDVAVVPLPQRMNQLKIWTGDQMSHLVVYALADGRIRTMDLTPDEIKPRAEIHLGGTIRLAAVLDYLPEPGPEILISVKDGATWIFNADLEPLAYHDDDPLPIHHLGVERIRGENDQHYFVARGRTLENGVRFSLERNPRDIPWAALALVGAVGGLIPVWHRRRKRKDPSQATLRELRLQLLDRLKLSGHGAIGSLSSLRRFIWNLDALLQGFDVKAGERNIFGQLTQEILDVQLPNLDSALELAELAQLDKERIGRARAAVDTLGEQIKALDREGFPPDMLKAASPALRTASDDAERAFSRLRRLVEGAFRADTGEIIQRVLEAHARNLGEANITVQADLSGLPAVGMDAEELAFVLENLVGNAVRAMRGGEQPELVIAWAAGETDVTVTVQDTGCGIVPDDWQRIFEPGYSTREGGGLGLPHSRDLLRKYSGNILVRDSQAGGGTTMAVILPKAADPQAN